MESKLVWIGVVVFLTHGLTAQGYFENTVEVEDMVLRFRPSASRQNIDRHRRCVNATDCLTLPDGTYQSCQGCHFYATCYKQHFVDKIPCNNTDLVWDDFYKECRLKSSTCPYGYNCLTKTDCKDKKDGDYQACGDCHSFGKCFHGGLADDKYIKCPVNLWWDDREKRCDWGTETCPPKPELKENADEISEVKADGEETGKLSLQAEGACVKNCSGVKDGDYRSCISCRVYVTCSNERLFIRPCPAGLVWSDAKKRCDYWSGTCYDDNHKCIKNCKDLPDGDYQSCSGCHVYASCVAGIIYNNRPCPASLVWDDNQKRCEYKSTTCHQ